MWDELIRLLSAVWYILLVIAGVIGAGLYIDHKEKQESQGESNEF